MERIMEIGLGLAALSCGAATGVFFAFSSFVMPALARLPVAQGISAMQSINVAAVTPLFMTALFGAAALCLALGIVLPWRIGLPGGAAALAGCVLYLAGVIGVTMACNVPRNNALAALDPQAADAATIWGTYLVEWSGWNHLRTIAGIAATACFILALA